MINKIKNIIFITSILFAFTFVSCKREFDEPGVFVPKVNFSGDTTIRYKTIQDLKTKLGANFLDTIIENIVIKAVVTANDESGNLYKTIFIQDATGGLEVKLDKASIYNNLKVGQSIYIKCKGLYVGKYGDAVQFGYIYNGAVGRIPETLMPNHVFLDSLPGVKPEPLVRSIDQLNDPNMVGRLIRIENCHFQKPLSPYVIPGEDISNRFLLNANGDKVIIRTSKYSKFANFPMSKGVGTVTGILSYFKPDYQFYIRDINDVKMDKSIIIDLDIINEPFDNEPVGWIILNLSNGKGWEWTGGFGKVMIASNYEGAPGSKSDSWLITPEVNLTNIDSAILNFKTWKNYTDPGLIGSPFEVYVLKNYMQGANILDVQKDAVSCTLPALNSVMTSSGNISLASYKQKIRIAFRYRSSSNSYSATKWEVEDFIIKGKF